MKKIVASVGLAALGASGLHTASAQELVSPDTSKPWSVGVTLRGFYDDNPSTAPNNMQIDDRGSFGFEVSPQAALAWSVEQTTVNLGLLYAFKYYDNVPSVSSTGLPYSYSGHSDQVFTFNAGLTHDFSDEVRARVSDAFVLGQEPDLLRAGNTFTTFYRESGDNIRNFGTIALDAQVTPVIGVGFGYDNAYYNYSASGATAVEVFPGIYQVSPSPSGILDRIENRAHIEGLYQLQPETKALLGYQFTQIDYTGDEPISGYYDAFTGFSSVINSDVRNMREHTMYIGAEQQFLPDLSGALRVGGSYADYFNDDQTSGTWTPYVNATAKYTYAPNSFVQGGVGYDRNPTDLVGNGGINNLVLDAQSVVVFASVVHQLDPRLFVSLMGQFQNSLYNGGFADNQSEQYYLAGLDFQYKFNNYFAAHVGYNYDRLESNLANRTFDRNRVYIGVTASY